MRATGSVITHNTSSFFHADAGSISQITQPNKTSLEKEILRTAQNRKTVFIALKQSFSFTE